jgi:hypothetical protein
VNPLPNKAPEAARHVVIVVPRRDMELYAYLKRSFSQAANVEVVLDRRERRASGAPTPTPDLRRPSAGRSLAAGVLLASSDPPRAPWPPARPKVMPKPDPKTSP